MPGCHGNAFWQVVSLVMFIRGGLDGNKEKVCVSTPWGVGRIIKNRKDSFVCVLVS